MYSSRTVSMVTFILSLFIFSNTAEAAKGSDAAGIVIKPAFSYWNHTDDNYTGATSGTLTKSNTSRTDMQFGLGYKFDMGLYIGGTYNAASATTKYEGGTESETKEAWTSYGPTVGFMKSNFFIFGTYHLSAEYSTEVSGTKITSYGGSALQFDIGYTFMITNNFGIGPQLTYYSADYKKFKTTGIDTDYPTARKQTDIRPLVHFQFMF